MREAFLRTAPGLRRAACISGASELWVFSSMHLPMAKGGMGTVVLLTFLQVWNEVLLASALAIIPKIANINTGLRILEDKGQAFAFGTLSAILLITLIPTLIVFLLLQRGNVRGISECAFAGA